MSVYHKKTGRISHIELKEAGKPCISKAYTIQNDIYMVPANSETPFLIFHTESNRYEIRKDFWTNIFSILTNSQKIFLDLYSSCMVDKELYSCGQRAKRAMLACTFGDCRRGQYPAALLRCKFDAPSACCGVVDLSAGNGVILRVNLESWFVIRYDLPQKYQIRNIYFDKGQFYFVLADQCTVVRWNDKENCCCEYLMEDRQITHPYMTITRWGKHLLLLPDQTDRIWEFNEEKNTWEPRDEYLPKDFYRKESHGSLFVGYQIWDNRLLLFPRAGNGMIVLAEEESRLYEVSYSGKRIRKMKAVWEGYIDEQSVSKNIISEDVITLEEYISALAYRFKENREKGCERSGEQIWNYLFRK